MKALAALASHAKLFWSYQETLDLAGLRATNPPLELITVANPRSIKLGIPT